ncbi:MAG: hypothetical protein E7812_07750 [Phenylobacterium sp.]|nr:MAG: hypothetical protein E7812_07750 [Phenylobacterium sp.]
MPTPGRRAPARAQTRAQTRTAEAKLRRKAQAMSGLALNTLAALLKTDDVAAPVRLAAAREVLDRGHGRPKLGGEGEGGDAEGLTVIVKRYSDVTDEERARASEGEA